MKELEDAIAEVRRELTIRTSVYPRLVMVGKLTQAEADKRKAHMGDAVAFLLVLRRHWQAVSTLDRERVDSLQSKHD